MKLICKSVGIYESCDTCKHRKPHNKITDLNLAFKKRTWACQVNSIYCECIPYDLKYIMKEVLKKVK